MSLQSFKESLSRFKEAFAEENKLLQEKPRKITERFEPLAYSSKKNYGRWQKQSKAELAAREVTYLAMDKNIVTHQLVEHLYDIGFDLVVCRHTVYGSVMEVCAILKDRIVEMVVYTNLVDLSAEFRKFYWKGQFKSNKHSAIEEGKGVPNFFYIVCPDGMLTRADIPAHCGLIYASVPYQKVLPVFNTAAVAPLLKKDYVTNGFYRNLVFKIDQDRRQLITRYKHCALKKFPAPADLPKNEIF